MNKDLIKQRFAKNLNTYKENANIQKKMAEKLSAYLDKNIYTNILEIGCGTGFLTEILNKKINFENYTANDIVPECSDFIKNINPEIEFIPGDIETLINKHNEKKYDLIVSNASLQWVDDFEGIVKTLTKNLSNKGILLFSTFGNENYREIFFVQGKKLEYHSAYELKQLFSEYSSTIEEEIHIMSFKTPKDVLKHLQLTGVNAIESKVWTKKDMKEFENSYNNLCSNRPTLTYNPVYIKISL